MPRGKDLFEIVKAIDTKGAIQSIQSTRDTEQGISRSWAREFTADPNGNYDNGVLWFLASQ